MKYFKIFYKTLLFLIVINNIFATVQENNEFENGINHRSIRSVNSAIECSSLLDCISCVSASAACDWCLDSNICTHNRTEYCKSDVLVKEVAYHNVTGACPQITPRDKNEILISAGTTKTIQVKIHAPIIPQTRFNCQFNIEGREIRKNAQLLGDTLYCDQLEFEYSTKSSNITVPFAALWGGDKPLANPQNVHVVIYRCKEMADNMEKCLDLNEKYECGWCYSTKTCEINSQCAFEVNQTKIWQNKENKISAKTNCSLLNTCTSCVSSEYNCNWCLDGNRCIQNTVEHCQNDILVTSSKREGSRSGPNFCPHIEQKNESNEILIQSGVNKMLQLKVNINGKFIVQTRFVCQFNIEGKIISINARLIADTIYCDGMNFQYESNSSNITVPLNILWGGTKQLDNPQHVHVVLYRCSSMANYIEKCLSFNEKYGCGWCTPANNCAFGTECNQELDEFHTKLNNKTENSLKTGCGIHNSCTTCVSSELNCDWCMDANTCIDNGAEKCQNDILISSNITKGSSFCPRITARDNHNEILIPDGTRKNIRFKVFSLGQFLVQTRFSCVFNFENRVSSRNATLLGDTIYCDTENFEYTSKIRNITIPFDVMWGGNHRLDKPAKLQITVYRCSEMAQNPDECLSLPEKYDCGWCPTSNTCMIEDKCNLNGDKTNEANKWQRKKYD